MSRRTRRKIERFGLFAMAAICAGTCYADWMLGDITVIAMFGPFGLVCLFKALFFNWNFSR